MPGSMDVIVRASLQNKKVARMDARAHCIATQSSDFKLCAPGSRDRALDARPSADAYSKGGARPLVRWNASY